MTRKEEINKAAYVSEHLHYGDSDVKSFIEGADKTMLDKVESYII